MNTLTLEHIAPFLPYGLKVLSKKHFIKYGECTPLLVNGMSFQDTASPQHWQYEFLHDNDLMFADINTKGFKPILYPMSWLTKEIMLPGYDKPVVPIEELANLILPGRNWVYNNQNDAVEFENFWFIKIDGDYVSFAYGFNKDLGDWDFLALGNQYTLFQKLASWKFNFLGIPDELIEYVTEEFNPYVS